MPPFPLFDIAKVVEQQHGTVEEMCQRVIALHQQPRCVTARIEYVGKEDDGNGIEQGE